MRIVRVEVEWPDAGCKTSVAPNVIDWAVLVFSANCPYSTSLMPQR